MPSPWARNASVILPTMPPGWANCGSSGLMKARTYA